MEFARCSQEREIIFGGSWQGGCRGGGVGECLVRFHGEGSV